MAGFDGLQKKIATTIAGLTVLAILFGFGGIGTDGMTVADAVILLFSGAILLAEVNFKLFTDMAKLDEVTPLQAVSLVMGTVTTLTGLLALTFVPIGPASSMVTVSKWLAGIVWGLFIVEGVF